MAVPETQAEVGRSSVTLTKNAKGETQVSVKCYAAPDGDIFQAEAEAISVYERLCERYASAV